ncbi:hypothetical protein [Ralstonia solanacearum]|uniref:hypothetical protein n=2 Tax=Ralstonia solanacearum TaxID=305 RepID=UPI000AC32327
MLHATTMQIIKKIIMISTLIAAKSVYAIDASKRPVAHPASTTSEATCPASDFKEFIQEFSDDQNIQQKSTKYPLEKLELDTKTKEEPKIVTLKLNRNQIHFPIIPSNQERAKQRLEIRFDNTSTSIASVTLTKPDTDYQVSYQFRKNNCWMLERIKDWSL